MTSFPLSDLQCRIRRNVCIRAVAIVSGVLLLLAGAAPVHARPPGFDGQFDEAMAQSRQQQRQALRKSLVESAPQKEEQSREFRRKLSSEERDALRRDLRDANHYGAQAGHKRR